jgi:hypothetical protein
METAPWASVKGEPIDSRFLARMLSKYEIPTNNTIKINGHAVKGYLLSHFWDAFERYAPSPEVGNLSNPGNSVVPNGTPAPVPCRSCGEPLHRLSVAVGTCPSCPGVEPVTS